MAVLPRVNDSFYALALAPDGRYAAAAGKKGGIYIWCLSDLKLLYQFKAPMGAVHTLAISADSLVWLSSGADHQIKLWSLTTSEPIKTFSANDTGIGTLAFIGSTYNFVSGDSDNTLKKWDFKTGQRIQAFGRSMWIWDVSFFKHGRLVATTDGTDFWVCHLGVTVCPVHKIKGDITVNTIAVSPDQKHLMVGGEKGR